MTSLLTRTLSTSRTLSRTLSTARSLSTSAYIWGAGAAGLTPCGTISGDVLEPRDITDNLAAYAGSEGMPPGSKIAKIVAGKGNNTAFLFAAEGGTHVKITGEDKYSAVSGTFPPNVRIDSVSLGPFNYSAIGTSAGSDTPDLYSWGFPGSNVAGFGQLGLGGVLSTPGDNHVAHPTLVTSLTEDCTPPSQVEHGSAHSMVLSLSSNEVLACGSGSYGRLGSPEPNDVLDYSPIDYLTSQATGATWKKVSVGSDFSLALDGDGNVYGYGKNDKGQIGQGGGMSMDMYAVEPLPTVVEYFSLANKKITDISAGYNHAAAVTDEGELYCWGGRSGFFEPELVTGLLGIDIVEVQCGNNFTVAVDAAGLLYTLSHGGTAGGVKAGACGGGDGKGGVDPRIIQLGGRVKELSVGWTHVAALVDDGPENAP